MLIFPNGHAVLHVRETETRGASVDKGYEAPSVVVLGSIGELTLNHIDKCGGSGDQFLPQLLDNRFALDCDA